MKIKSVRLDNWRSYKGRNEINGLDRVNVFLGLNGAGKSTILDAICFALTGCCRGTDQGGRGADKLVSVSSDGQAKADGFQVVIVTEKGEIARTLGAGPNSKFQETVNKLVGPRKGRNTLAVEVALQPHSFLSLSTAEQKALLLSVVGAEIDATAVASQLGELATHLPPGSLDSLQMLDAAEKGLRERRPTIKRAIDELVVPTPPDLEVRIPEGMTPQVAIADAKKEVASIREEYNELTVSMRTREQQISSRASRLTTAGEAVKATKAKLARHMSEQEIVDKIKVLSGQLNAVGAKAKEEQAIRAKAEAASAAAVEIAHALSVLLSGDQAIGLCPKCLPKMRELLKSYEKEVKGFERKVTAPVRPEASTKKIEEELEVLYQAGELLERLKAEITAAEKSLKAVSEEKIEAVDEEKERQRAKGLLSAMEKGQNYIERLQKVVYAGEQAERIRARRAELESDLAQVEALIKRIGPGGDVRASLLGPRLSEFEAEVNALTEAVDWGKVEARLEGSGFLLRYAPSGVQVPLEAEMLSTSEQYRLSLVLAAAIARRAGLGILCLDGAEILVGQNKAALGALLDEAKLEQVFVCASTASDAPPDAPEGWAFYSVTKEGSKSQVVEVKAGVPSQT